MVVVTALAIVVAVCALAPRIQAQGVDSAQLERLRRIVEQQQTQIDSQAGMLEALRGRVNALARSDAQAREQVTQAQEPKKMVSSGKSAIKLSLSGQVNRGVLLVDDGNDRHIFHVDTDNSSTRFRLVGTGNFNEDLSVGTQIEVQIESNSTASVNQFSSRGIGAGGFSERKLEFYVDSKRFGRLWVGQGDTASNGTSQADLSGTSIIGGSSVTMASGLIFSRGGAQPLAGDVTVGAAFNDLDGLGRDDRVRYDTPSFRGFKLSASAVAGGLWDVAGRYSAEFLDTKLAAAVAYWKRTGSDGVNGSITALHKTGINLTVAAGKRDFKAAGRSGATFYYAKLGFTRAFFPNIGKTALAVDYYHGDDFAAAGDNSNAYGGLLVQKFDRIATEFYLGGRVYALGRGAGFRNIIAVLSGARIKF